MQVDTESSLWQAGPGRQRKAIMTIVFRSLLTDLKLIRVTAPPRLSLLLQPPSRPAEMHHCLYIAEVLDRIFDYLPPDYYPSNRRTLAALARTCKAFTEPASRKLWHTLTRIEHLLRCLPPDCWEYFLTSASGPARKTIRFTRALTSADWKTIANHRRRVREFKNGMWGELGVAPSHLLEAIEAILAGEPLFPNIRDLSWRHTAHYTTADFFRWAAIFVGPRLTDLMLRHEGFTSNKEVEMLGGLDIPFANLLNLDLFASRSESAVPLASILSTSSSFALALSSPIETLALPRITADAWRHLASLPKLFDLTLYEPQAGDLTPLHHLPSGSFRALNSLHLSDISIAFAIEMLKTVPDWRLWRLIIGSRKPETRLTVQRLYDAIASCCVTEELEELWIGPLYQDEDTEDPPAGTMGDYSLSGDTLSRLFPFQNLVDITLRPPSGFIVDDGVIRDLASAWPNVMVLRLASGSTRQSRAATTLNALRVLAESCPYLHDLMLPLNASTVPAFQTYRARRITQTALASLDVGISPIGDSKEVARFISGHFASISVVSTFCAWRWDDGGYQASDGEQREKTFHVRWKEVDMMLEFGNKVRKEEQYWAENEVEEA
uniref:F-box domain-containing protein n=1 Tax=Mycena chlorophos TaxID=658473 RepID=A0ABQ0LR28_MYCCL|nr:predicted protein [Mycena chlorophos]